MKKVLGTREKNILLDIINNPNNEQLKLSQEEKNEMINNEFEYDENSLNRIKRDKEDELVQYFIVNSELNMSSGKIAAQVGHVATIITHDVLIHKYESDYEIVENWYWWLYKDQPKIILRGKQKDMEKLIEQGWYYIRDNGRTEIPADSLTVIGCAPEYKSIMKPIVKRFQLL